MTLAWRQFLRLVLLVLVCAVALQLYFVARVALMALADPGSTTFQRSEIWRLARDQGRVAWGQQWVDDERLGKAIKRAVIASEDSTFADHDGVNWDAMERAWERNQRAQERADRRNERTAKIVGGSTITQQLAKNLFLSGERTPWRKGQELLLTYVLETCLSKQRILEIYLNHVEWGEGLFGAQAAARYYFRADAAQLSAWQAARLAVMLPAPKRFEKRMSSAWLADRASTVTARMAAVELP
jgi:monofunctional biosynthetic peptidoglycan transglycosylase